MIVYDAFGGDDNKALKLVQHDLWFRTNDLWIDSDGLAMSSCFYLFSLARKSSCLTRAKTLCFSLNVNKFPRSIASISAYYKMHTN